MQYQDALVRTFIFDPPDFYPFFSEHALITHTDEQTNPYRIVLVWKKKTWIAQFHSFLRWYAPLCFTPVNSAIWTKHIVHLLRN